MDISKETVEYTARLARLGLLEDEKLLYAKQLNDILKYIDVINSVDTKDISPTAHAQMKEKKTPMREDEVFPFKDVEMILDIAPEKEDHMYRVPKILESGENGAI